MDIYINVYPDPNNSLEKAVVRVYKTKERALYQRLKTCIGTFKINSLTRESQEIKPEFSNETTLKL